CSIRPVAGGLSPRLGQRPLQRSLSQEGAFLWNGHGPRPAHAPVSRCPDFQIPGPPARRNRDRDGHRTFGKSPLSLVDLYWKARRLARERRGAASRRTRLILL